MNLSQVANVQAYVKQAQSYDFNNLVQRVYPNREDLEAIQINNFTVFEFISVSKKVFENFEMEFVDRSKTLVYSFTFSHAQYGLSQIDSQINQFISHLNSNNLNAAEQNIEWLTSYQLKYGFYFKNQKKSKEVLSDYYRQLVEKLNLIEESIKNKLAISETIKADILNQKKELEFLIAQKREELSQITTNLSTSNTQVTQITEILNKGVAADSKLTSIIDHQEQNKASFDKRLSELETVYKNTNHELKGHTSSVEDQVEKFQELNVKFKQDLDFVESKKVFFDERIKYLEELIGREVGASLFETFKQRKTELNDQIKFWRWAVPIMTGLTIGWIFFLFHNQNTITSINLWWQAFAINTIKSIPAVLLLIFSISQYRRERNFQEEYAFKSAVALTIDAYSGRLLDPVNKDKLIMEAVLGVYKTPIQDGVAEKLNTGGAFDTIKTMAETAKELVKSNK